MYVTRTLSQLRRSPDLVSSLPDGPNSGYLVIQDEESQKYSFLGFKNRILTDLPFPQNKMLDTVYGDDSRGAFFLIPALNQPLSSNLYYAIQPHGKHKGEALTCSKEEDKVTCCCRLVVLDVESRPLDLQNIYQLFQIAIHRGGGYFLAKSVAPDGFPPFSHRPEGWTIRTWTPKDNFNLHEAHGVDSALRARHPALNISPSVESSEPVLVGKWYCPFMFVKERTLRDQMKQSMYYLVTLEQRWVQIFNVQKNNLPDHQGNSVEIDAFVKKEQVFIDGHEAAWSTTSAANGIILFTVHDSGGGQVSVGLREEVVGRMKWEQQRFGWVGGEETQVKINRIVKFDGSWSELKCYVLFERFNLKRTDGSLVIAYDFMHPHQLRIKWIR